MLNLLPTLLTVASIATSALAVPVVKVTNSGAASAIPDQYIVVFKDGVTDSATDAHTSRISSFHSAIEARDPKSKKGRKRTRGVHQKIKVTGKSKFRGYTGEFDQETLAEILKSPEVSYVEQDAVVKVNLGKVLEDTPEENDTLEKRVYRSSSTWGLDRISHSNYAAPYRYYYNDNFSGEGATVYVIDTGIKKEHWQFRDMYTGQTRVRWGINTVDDDNTDGAGHGTHCAGTIGGLTYGISRKVSLVAVKVLDKDGYGSWSSVIEGINWVAKDAKSGYAVASLSLGGGKSTAVNQAIDALHNAGVTVVVAAGNENDDASKYSPASASKAITVGAIDEQGQVPDFSNYGSKVDFLAPGVDVLSSVINPKDDTATDYYSGTSMATPHVAGLAAYFISKSIKENNKGVAPADLKQILINNSFTSTDKVLGKYRRGASNRIAGNNYCNDSYACAE
uniref:Cuticle-degrading serine protease n=1 Tax=Arthrobotrys megalospora TaxID=2528406 RepID=Q65Z76_9PEZI|nr:serine protease [Arthrobotrys megalospora]